MNKIKGENEVDGEGEGEQYNDHDNIIGSESGENDGDIIVMNAAEQELLSGINDNTIPNN